MLDDIIVYRRGETNFMVVVNASNEPKIRFYLHELQAGPGGRRYRSFRVGGQAAAPAGVDLGHAGPEPAQDRRVDLALQGPASVDALAKLTDAYGLEADLPN